MVPSSLQVAVLGTGEGWMERAIDSLSSAFPGAWLHAVLAPHTYIFWTFCLAGVLPWEMPRLSCGKAPKGDTQWLPGTRLSWGRRVT